MSRLRSLLADSRFLSFIGLTAVVAFFFLGAHTLQMALKWAAVASVVILLLWLSIWLIKRHRASRSADAIGHLLARAGVATRHAVEDGSQAEIDALQARIHDAVRTIKTSKLGQTSGRAALYELPWLMVIGNPAAGKSTAIVNSGLKFPFDDGKSCIIKGIGGTRNCDWFFTTEGILLDTAGRYAVHEDDRPEWLGFLRLLRRHRPLAPINGIIVTVSIGELLGNPPSFAINLAKNLRQRVQELTEHLEIFAPVYVLFSKADLIPGFHEFFEDLDWNERNRVWGATHPYDPNGTQDIVKLFDDRFAELYDGLRALSIAQMARSQGESVAPGLLTFPSEFKAIQAALRAFLATLFEDNPFQFKPIFRGFYITSAVQQGEARPLSNERVIKRFDLTGGNPMPIRAAAQNGFFLRDLFSRVIFADRNLVKQYVSRTRSLLRQATVFGALACLGLALGGWTWSYLNNHSLLISVQQDLDKAVKVQDGKIDLQSRMEALAILQDRLAQLERFEKEHPLSVGLGLYRGDLLAQQLRREYYAGISNIMLSPVKDSLESFLHDVNAHASDIHMQASKVASAPPRDARPYKEAAPTQVEDAYNGLKTYLMLASREHLDVGHLSDQITRFWRGWLEANRGTMTREQMIRLAERLLSFHLEHATDPDWPLIDNNLAIVDQTRENLRRVVRGMPAAERVYAEIKARASTRFAPVTVANLLGPENARLVSGSHVVAGSFTKEAWDGYVRDAIKDAATDARDSTDWVLRTSTKDDLTLEGSPEQIQKSLVAMYKTEYAAEWRRFVEGVSVVRFDGFGEAVAAMDKLGDPQNSPVGTILNTVFQQTSWDNPSMANVGLDKAQKGFIDWFKRSVLRMAPSRVQVDVDLSAKSMTVPMGPIGSEFQGLARLMVTRDNADPLASTYLKQLSRLRSQLNQLKNQGDPGPGAVKLLRNTIEGSESELANTLRFVEEQMLTGMSDSQRAGLRPLLLSPLLHSYAAVVQPAEIELNKIWVAQVFQPFNQKLAIKYPFATSASLEATPGEIAQIFGPEGAIAKFVDGGVGSLVVRRGDIIETRTWGDQGLSLRPDFASGFSRWVAPLEGGAAGSAGGSGEADSAPQTVFMLRPQPAPDTTGYVIEIDGQRLEYRNGLSKWANFVWPAATGAPGARISATTFDGQVVEVLNFPGRFGLEKMINEARRNRQPDGTFRMSWSTGPVSVAVDLKLVSATQAQAAPSDTESHGARGLAGITLPLEVMGNTDTHAPLVAAPVITTIAEATR